MAMMTKTKRQLTIRVQFNRNFQEYNTTKKRYRLAKGSAGSGKSVNTAQDYIIKLGDMRYKGANLLCVRKVAESNKDSTYAELKSAIYKIYGSHYRKYWTIKASPIAFAPTLSESYRKNNQRIDVKPNYIETLDTVERDRKSVV